MINKILNRASCRSYKLKNIEKSKIEKLKKIINSSPTSVNASQFSAIFITDKKTKQDIASMNWDQPHIMQAPLIVVFVADYNRVDYCLKQDKIDGIKTTNNVQSLLTGTIDATIASSFCYNAALDLGLACCYLGGIRRNISKASKILKLEGKTMPIIALSIGYEDKPSILRPKTNRTYEEKYDIKQVQDEMKNFDVVYKNFNKKTINKDVGYTDHINVVYSNKMKSNNEFEEIKNQYKIDFKN